MLQNIYNYIRVCTLLTDISTPTSGATEAILGSSSDLF